MKTIIPAALSILLSGCESLSPRTTVPNLRPNLLPVSHSLPASYSLPIAYKCPATPKTEAAFADTFVSRRGDDIKWSGPVSSDPISVDDIAQAFNKARRRDWTIREKLKMPHQSVWDRMSSSQKGLFLINSERCARGIEPFEGIAPQMIVSSRIYARELSNNNAFSHYFGNYRDPWARLKGYANVDTEYNADFMAYGENLSVSTASSDEGYLAIYEPVARAIYGYMYEDANSAYEHRQFSLIKITNDNSGRQGAEGLFGLSLKQRRNLALPFFKTQVTTVMHAFDPNENWNMSTVITPTPIFGPRDATDCLSGTFRRSDDGRGSNTSICHW